METKRMERGNVTMYKDTGCELSPKCTECLVLLERCPEQMESRQWHQGELSPGVVRRLTALRVAAGGDILDGGSPMNLRWKKYWADRRVSA